VSTPSRGSRSHQQGPQEQNLPDRPEKGRWSSYRRLEGQPESFNLPDTVYCKTPEEMDVVVEKYFVGQKALGFDIEWKPNFTSGEDNDTAVIQLSSTQVTLVAHVAYLYPMVLPPFLKAVLEDERIWKCGVGIHNDLEKLNQDFELCCKGFIDVGVVYTAYGNPEGGIKKMSEAFGLKMNKSKSVAMSNWEADDLSRNQIFYAAQDAYAGIWLLHLIFLKYASVESADAESAENAIALQEWGALYESVHNFKMLTQMRDLSRYPEEVQQAIQAAHDSMAETKARKAAKQAVKQAAREASSGANKTVAQEQPAAATWRAVAPPHSGTVAQLTQCAAPLDELVLELAQ